MTHDSNTRVLMRFLREKEKTRNSKNQKKRVLYFGTEIGGENEISVFQSSNVAKKRTIALKYVSAWESHALFEIYAQKLEKVPSASEYQMTESGSPRSYFSIFWTQNCTTQRVFFKSAK
jgi:hypothetical protein